MKSLILIIPLIVIFASCKKEPIQSEAINYGTEKNVRANQSKGNGHHSTATQFHYYSIHDSIGDVAGTPRLFLIGEQIVPFPAGTQHWDMQINHSMTDSAHAVPAEFAYFIFGNGNSAGFNPAYFAVYDANSFPGQGIATYWFVGESAIDFSDPSTWFTTGSAFDQVTWNADGTLTH